MIASTPTRPPRYSRGHFAARTAVAVVLGLNVTGSGQDAQPLHPDVRAEITAEMKSIAGSLTQLRRASIAGRADAEVFHKGLIWALRYDREFTPADVTLLRKAVLLGKQRIAALEKGQPEWRTRKGKVGLGYVSEVDGSVQPYGLIVPKSYDAALPMRLDVVLHGSTRPVGLSELRFLARFDEAAGEPPDQPFLELHPLGRVENCYRWAGETDVFEAIEDVCRRYNVDRDRIVLRGMSMGASGTWHLGLKHPDRFVALGPYCGYVDTHRFSETPLPAFVKVGPLPEHQERGLHLLDSVDYAANAGVVPVVACMGEKDVFFQAHVLMAEAMRREGLTLVNLISPGTGHVIDPVTHAEQMRRLGEFSAAGLNRKPRELRFVTWSLKYSRCHWLRVLGLESHYRRAELAASLREGHLKLPEPVNVTRLAILPAQLPDPLKSLQIGSAEVPLPECLALQSPGLVIQKHQGRWTIAGNLTGVKLTGKRPGLQGPIDDAFTTRFLCVRGTGRPWNAAANQHAQSRLQEFADEWHHYFRGDLPVKDDVEVTDDDTRTCNLILFGDPGSNLWIARALPQLPLTWTPETLTFAGTSYSAAEHLPALIAESPLSGENPRYLVLNSGHTFREAELAKLNYLLFPRWGDWAILRVRPQASAPPVTDHVVRAGYFAEDWRTVVGE